MSLFELDQSFQHQKHGDFSLTAVVVKLLVIKQELFIYIYMKLSHVSCL